MFYYQFNIGDYQSHTSHLSEMEDLAYRRMLDWYYLHEKPLPADYAEIARLIRMRSHIDCIAIVLHEYFDCVKDGWIHHRANKEIAKAGDKSEKASASAKARWSKKDANVLPTQSEGNATHNTLPITQDTKHIKENKRGSRLPQDFFFPKEWCDFIAEQRPELNAQKTFDQFKDYWIAQAGQKGVKLDWFATWRNWVRNTNAPKTNFADIARVTVPSSNLPDPELEKIKADDKKAAPIPLEVLAKMAQLRGKS